MIPGIGAYPTVSWKRKVIKTSASTLHISIPYTQFCESVLDGRNDAYLAILFKVFVSQVVSLGFEHQTINFQQVLVVKTEWGLFKLC